MYASGHKKTLTPCLIDQDISVTGTTPKRLDLNRPITQLDLPVPHTLMIVFFALNMAQGTILSTIDPVPFLIRDHSISLRPVFHLIDMFLLLDQSIRFPLIQLTTGDPLIDPLFLVRLALIDHKCFSLCNRHPVHQQHHPTDCE